MTKFRPRLACSAALATCMALPAYAQQTPPQTAAGTQINNQATVTYEVGGSSTTVSSNVASFVVDKKVNLAVAEVGGGPTLVAPGTTGQVTTFTVTNLTNSVQDFRLEAQQQSVSIPLLGTDNFDVTNMRVFVDDGDGVFDADKDTATFIDELAPDATVTVFIVADIPNTPGYDTAHVSLNAVAAAGGSTGALGADLQESSRLVADSPTTVEIVFADGDGLFDLARNGQMRAFDAYKVSVAAISIAKTARVISDPVNLLLNPHPIPGATVEYCIRVDNAGPLSAGNVVVGDVVPDNTTYVPGSITVGTAGLLGACILLGTAEDDNDTGGDETDGFGGSFDGTRVRGVIPSIGVSAAYAVAFRVTLN